VEEGKRKGPGNIRSVGGIVIGVVRAKALKPAGGGEDDILREKGRTKLGKISEKNRGTLDRPPIVGAVTAKTSGKATR